MAADKTKLHVYTLKQDQELRFEVESTGEKVYLMLKSGLAEIFGTEIVIGKIYEFTAGAKVAVFTWFGCVVEVKGQTDVLYTAKETPMVIYSNCHAALDFMRTEAVKENKRGPIAMIVGPNDVGKSTFSRILLNYAVRMGKRPIYVDLDVSQGHISIPGTIGAMMIERPASIEEGFSQEAPLVFHYGYESPSANPNLFNLIVQQMATTVKNRLEVDRKTRHSGVIVNTCGWIQGSGYKQLLTSANAFEVDVMMVLDQERLYNGLVRDMPNFVEVVHLPKSGGVVQRCNSVRSEARDQRVMEYFYGTPRVSLYPHSFDVKYSDVKIFKIGAPALPDSCLPIGMKSEDHMTKVVLLTPNASLLHHILAISFSEKEDADEVISSNVLGFVCVTKIDTTRQIITLLSPQPGPLPNHILVFSECRFMDAH